MINNLTGRGRLTPSSGALFSSVKKKDNFLSETSDVFTLSIPEQKINGNYNEKPEETFKPESEYSFSLYPETSFHEKNAPVTIGIININDEHDNTFKKFPKEAAIVREREDHYGDENSFIINLGDVTYNGNNKEKGPGFFGPVTDILNSMDVELFVPGNHDFDHGGNYLEEEVISKINAKTLAANVEYKTGNTMDNTLPYRIEEVKGVKIGFIGLTTPKHKDKEEKDVVVNSIENSAEKYIPMVKKEGADLVVLLMHEGVNTARHIASTVPGIDIIVAGHDHKKCAEEIKNPDGKNTLVVEAGGNTNYVGDIAISVEPSTKKIVKVDYRLFSTKGVAPDKEVSDIIKKYKNDLKN